uniref:NADH dehydrogenase subunit 2 n=1 Tax=Khawia sinensis TaxID=125900 RepID=A0A1W5IX03_9CEST|nr:NADH dehydrogenase subunit 2 [Khawia sinensis]ALK26533.1 NADH dehydrogenase subunit 2 [Khawia sinensis]
MRFANVGLAGFSVFASTIFIFFSSCVDSLFGFWVFLELAGLGAVPAFFLLLGSGLSGVYTGLFNYVIVSALSSVCFVSGFIFGGLFNFIVLGFIVKLGLFPFMFWVYRVYSVSNWLFIFLLSVVLKYPVLYFGYILGGAAVEILIVDCLSTVVVCGIAFWVWSNSWQFVWCHMSLSSVATLLFACYSGDFLICWFIFLYYSVWALLCVCYFYSLPFDRSYSRSVWLFCFLLLVTPLSFPLFYKLAVCVALFYSSLYLLLAWAFYSFSEQFFLFKLCGDVTRQGVINNWFS